jgi:hypothetical protein
MKKEAEMINTIKKDNNKLNKKKKEGKAEFYVLLTVHLDAILGNDQLDAQFFLNVFILCLYMFRTASVHHQEGQIVLIHHLA